MKKTGIPEIDQINARHEGDYGDDIVRVDEPPYAATMTDAERAQAAMVGAATRALSGETPAGGEDKGWLLLGGIHFKQPLYVKDGNGVPLVKITVEPMPNVPADYLQRVLPVLVKRDQEGGLLRVTIRFDDDSMAHSNQPTDEQIAEHAMGLLAKIGGVKQATANPEPPKPPMPTKFTGFKKKG